MNIKIRHWRKALDAGDSSRRIYQFIAYPDRRPRIDDNKPQGRGAPEKPKTEASVDPRPDNKERAEKLFNKLAKRTEEALEGIDYLSVDHVEHAYPGDVRCQADSAVVVFGRTYMHANEMIKYNGKTIACTQRPDKDAVIFWDAVRLKEYHTIIDFTTAADKVVYYPTGDEVYSPSELYSITLVKKEGIKSEYLLKFASSEECNRTITRYHYDQWIDATAVTVDVLGDILKYLEEGIEKSNVFVHCNNGVGSGTYVIAFYLKQAIASGEITKENFISKLSEKVIEFRQKRGRLVVSVVAQMELLLNFGEKLLAEKAKSKASH